MLRFRSRLFSASVRKFIDEAKVIAPSLTGDDLAVVALTLQAEEGQKEEKRLTQEKKTEKEALMRQFAPMYNRRALDILVGHLRDSKEFQHVVKFKGSKNRVNMAATAKNMRAYLETQGCTDKREKRALRKIYKDLSDELQCMPLPLSIESARWAGLEPDQLDLMDTVYQWVNRKVT
jgi:hypothetical protein